MSQLSFVDVFDMARESAGGCCVTQDAEAGNGYFPSVHRLMSAQHSRSRFLEGANKQVISSQADSLIKISRIWADFFPANTSNQPI